MTLSEKVMEVIVQCYPKNPGDDCLLDRINAHKAIMQAFEDSLPKRKNPKLGQFIPNEDIHNEYGLRDGYNNCLDEIKKGLK